MATTALITAATAILALQRQPALVGAQFDVVSIKRNTSVMEGGRARTLPDGTFLMTHGRIREIMNAASPEPVTDITGLPDWVMTERYDIVAKPEPGSTPSREQRIEMMRNMLIERFKVVGHVEEVGRSTFAMVLARSDGRPGPQLKKSTVDCLAGPAAPTAAPPATAVDARSSCGLNMGPGIIESGGIPLDQFARSLGGLAGGAVNDRTGLEGWYAFTLRFAPLRLSGDPSAPVDDAPQFVTALQEQLGLKLVPEKTRVKIFVVDHIERPTPN